MILLIDNYDSFVHNLARYVRELGGEAIVRRNDDLTLGEIEALAPSHIILSPGPCSPAEAGISTSIVRTFANEFIAHYKRGCQSCRDLVLPKIHDFDETKNVFTYSPGRQIP